MSLSKKFFVKIEKIKNSRENLIHILNKTVEKKRNIKIEIQRSSLTIKQGGMHTSEKAQFTKNKLAELSILQAEYDYIRQSLSYINKQIKRDNERTQKYPSKVSQVFMTCAKDALCEKEFKKIHNTALKILRDRNQQYS